MLFGGDSVGSILRAVEQSLEALITVAHACWRVVLLSNLVLLLVLVVGVTELILTFGGRGVRQMIAIVVDELLVVNC